MTFCTVPTSLYTLPWGDKGTGRIPLPETLRGEPRPPCAPRIAQGTCQVRGKRDQKPGQGLQLLPVTRLLSIPLFWIGVQGPGLTCDGAVVVIPWDPGQPHAPLGQVCELQVPGSVWPSWKQSKKTPRGTPQ